MALTHALTPDALGLVAQDLPRTLAFYRALGLEIPAEADGAPHVEVTLPGGFSIMFDPVETIRSFDPDWTPATGSPGGSLAFGCESPAEVDEKYVEMVAAGFEGHLAPWDAPWGQRYATLRDPNGFGVDLYAALPTT
jgi:catechol 2,3-dioxygenase-like lactoylglutathione lyase family enzyme